MKPPFAYFGGKTSMADRIADLFPPHGHYVEPFAGSLAVLLAKPRSAMETVNDLDDHLMTFWRVLRDRPAELARVCMLTPHSRAEYARCRDRDATDDLELARQVWVGLTQGRGGTLRDAKTGWRFFRDRAGSSIGMPGYLASYVERILEDAERLAGVSLESKPALDLIREYGQHATTLIYADPPYLASTRGWGANYRVEMRQDDEHRELAEALRDCVGSVVLSGYASPLYDDVLYPDWHRIELSAFTGNAVIGNRIEVLWSNRPLGRFHAAELDFGEAMA